MEQTIWFENLFSKKIPFLEKKSSIFSFFFELHQNTFAKLKRPFDFLLWVYKQFEKVKTFLRIVADNPDRLACRK